MSRARDLSKLGNINTFAVDSTDTQVGIASTVPNATLDVGGDGVFTGIVTATSFSGSGANLTGIANTATIVSTATTTGLLNVTGTTDSTSSTTGSVTIAGGVGIAKNVYIGAGLSIAGTLTYEDVTNVDSVGMVTAKSGVNVTGGQIQVGAAFSVGPAGVVTATSYYGDGSNLSNITSTTINNNADNRLITGSGTANTLNGESTLTYDGTNLDLTDNKKIRLGTGNDFEIYHDATNNVLKSASSQYIRAASDGGFWVWDTDQSDGWVAGFDPGATNAVQLRDGGYNTRLQVVEGGVVVTGVSTATGGHITGGGEFKVGTALTVASTSGVATFSNDVTFKDAGYQGIKFENSGVKFSDQDVFFVGDNQTIKWVHDANCIRWEDSAQAQFGTGQDLRVYHDGSHSYFNETTGQIKLRLGGNDRIVINNSGTVTTGITTANGAAFDCTVGPLKEKVKITAGKLSDNTNIDLYDGMVHYFTTQETTTSTPTIRYRNSTNTALNHVMSIGDVVTVTVITTAAAAGYSANWAIDGNNVTEEWVGGSAPTAGGSDGLDIYSLTIIKTADATFTVVANLSNASN